MSQEAERLALQDLQELLEQPESARPVRQGLPALLVAALPVQPESAQPLPDLLGLLEALELLAQQVLALQVLQAQLEALAILALPEEPGRRVRVQRGPQVRLARRGRLVRRYMR